MKFSKPLLITKLKATGVHLCLSVAIFIVLVYQIYYNWYPQPYFSIDGGWQGVRLIAAVDLILGPLITFLIFDLSKSRREILFDLTTIAVIQFAALGYGIHVTHSQRPVAVAMIGQYVVSGTMEQVGGKIETPADLYQYSDVRPPIIYADLQLDQRALDDIVNIDLWANVLEYVQEHAKDPRAELTAALRRMQPAFSAMLDQLDSREAFESWLEQNGKKKDEVMIARLAGRYGEAWLVFDLEGEQLSYFSRNGGQIPD